MLAFLKLILAFAPWIAFLIIAHDSLLRLKIGIAVALALSVVMGVARLHRGIILWTGLLFFTYACIAVVLFESKWTMHYMGVLANGALSAGAWLTVAMKKPFTLDYAKAHTDPAVWSNPAFLRLNFILTSVWGAAFTINAALAALAAFNPGFPALTRELLSYTFLISAAIFTTTYPKTVARKRQQPSGPRR